MSSVHRSCICEMTRRLPAYPAAVYSCCQVSDTARRILFQNPGAYWQYSPPSRSLQMKSAEVQILSHGQNKPDLYTPSCTHTSLWLYYALPPVFPEDPAHNFAASHHQKPQTGWTASHRKSIHRPGRVHVRPYWPLDQTCSIPYQWSCLSVHPYGRPCAWIYRL